MPSWRTARIHPARSEVTSADAESAPSSPSRPPVFDAEAYKQRNAVERCINRFKQRRGLAMRTDKLAIAYQAAFHLAAILMWTRR
ncbi:transposase [Streptomyces sp. NPDC035033]|uniref:transposase n=1 Tax=Streptomyces sp. NPDC035033 TaxID=3155368 RepID=UPI0033DE170F